MAVTAASAIFLLGSTNIGQANLAAMIILIILISLVAVGMIINLVVKDTVLHHYSRACEDEVSKLMGPSPDASLLEPDRWLPLWTTTSRQIVTFNLRHVRAYSLPFFFPLLIAITSGAISPVVICILIIELSPEDSLAKSILDTITTSIPPPAAWVTGIAYLAGCSCTLIWAAVMGNQRSSWMFESALASARGQEAPPRPHASRHAGGQRGKTTLSYLVFPRPADSIKWGFTIYGLILGFLWSPQVESAGYALFTSCIVILFFEFLAYQSRYQWNDLRGMTEDHEHPLSTSRGRLPLSGWSAVRLTTITMTVRMILATIVVVSNFNRTLLPGLVGIALVWIIAALYEWSRSSDRGHMTYAVVGLGYPLRQFVGIWCAWPAMLSAPGGLDFEEAVTLSCILAGTYLFGLTFDGLTWAHEGILSLQEDRDISKPHLRWLTDCALADQRIGSDIDRYRAECGSLAQTTSGRLDSLRLYYGKMIDQRTAQWKEYRRTTPLPGMVIRRPHPFRPRQPWTTPWNIAYLTMCSSLGTGLVASSIGQKNAPELMVSAMLFSMGACALACLDVPTGGNRRNDIAFVMSVVTMATSAGVAIGMDRHGAYCVPWIAYVAYISVYMALRILNYEEMNTPLADSLIRWSRIGAPVALRLLVGFRTWRDLKSPGKTSG